MRGGGGSAQRVEGGSSGVCAGTEVEFVSIEREPPSVECRYDGMLAVPEIVEKIREAEEDDCDAAIVNGFVDLGVRIGREG